MEFKFKIGQTVTPKPIGGVARIVGIRIYSMGPEYDCRYFHDGEARCVWFFEEELEAI